MKKVKTRHALLMSVASLVICVTMLFGSTFAWFTDSVSSGVNRIVAGNLDVKLYHSSTSDTAEADVTSATTDLFKVPVNGSATLWEPGAMAIETFKVENAGNLALKYEFALNQLAAGDYNTTTDPAGHDLREVIKIAVADTRPADRAAAQALSFMSWNAFVAGASRVGKLAPGQSESFSVVLYWQPNDNATDNIYNLNNGKTSSDGTALFINASIALNATQDTVEADSFDNQYDVNADGVHTFATAEYVDVATDGSGVTTAAATVSAKNAAGQTVATVTVPVGVDVDAEKLSLQPGPATETVGADTVTVTGQIDLVNEKGEKVDLDTNDVPLPATYFVGKNLGASAKIELTLHHTSGGSTTFKTGSAGGSGDTLMTYDSATGYVSFSSKKFCPVSIVFEKPEAKNGDTFYARLTEALAEAADSATVELLRNVTVAEPVFISKNLTLDGNGYTIYSKANRGIRVNANDVTANIEDLTVIAAANNGNFERGFQIDGDKTNVTLNIRRCKTQSTYYAINVCNGVTAHINISDSEITGWGALNLWAGGYVVNVENSTLSGVNDKGYNAEGWNNFGTVVLEGDTTHATQMHASNNQVNLTNCTIKAAATTGNSQHLFLYNSGAENNVVALTNCTLVKANESDEIYLDHGTGSSLQIGGEEQIASA